MSNRPQMDDYIDVAERLIEFRTKHPEGSCQQVDVQFIDFAGASWVVYTAAAYRTPDDPRPGHGTAWEPVPGKTPFTRDSELQNAETAAWGRAIVAALVTDTKRGIASRQEVRNRSDVGHEEEAKPMTARTRGQMFALFGQKGIPEAAQLAGINAATGASYSSRADVSEAHAKQVIEVLKKRPDVAPVAPAEDPDADYVAAVNAGGA